MIIELSLVAIMVGQADNPATISPPRIADSGVLVHTVRSPYQAGETQIKVLQPGSLQSGKRYPVIYVLPVEEQGGKRWGDGLAEIIARDLHKAHQTIFVEPTFSHLPWYTDHPTDRAIRQESYFVNVVVPFIDKTYPVIRAAQGRLLLGFSKSGWGAWCLLLRHPDRFGRAAAWDSPLMMDQLGKYGTTPIFGTEKNLRQYRLTDLLRAKSNDLGGERRLILTGYGNFREHHQQMHQLLLDLQVPHHYQDGPHRPHDWHSGWVPEAVELLLDSD
jgi:enterochelin esterase-like enzyme